MLQYFKSKEFLVSIMAIVVISILLVFGLMQWMDTYTHHDEKIEVPDLSKLSIDETLEILDNKKLSFVVIDSASFNPKYPPKSVIEQDPEAGSYVKENRKIYLTLNPSNFRIIEIPEVIDKTKRQVITQLKSIGFKIGEERYIPDLGKDVVRALEIKGKEIKPGDKFPKETAIDLVLGDGLVEKDSIGAPANN